MGDEPFFLCTILFEVEIKKNINADLERTRMPRFLIGLAVALAVFIVALELSFHDSGSIYDSDFLDEIAEDMEFLPPIEDNTPMPPEEQALAQTDRINVVEEIRRDEEDQKALEEIQPEVLTETEVEEEKEEEKLEPVEIEEKQEEIKTMRELDDLPIFPGGTSQLIKWLTTNLKYPDAAKKSKISGKVMVAFVVNKDGSVSDAKILKPVDPLLDNEALRVIRMMPKWEPGLMKGKPCRTLVHLPVVFKL